MLDSYICCCTSDKQLDAEYELVGLRHENVVSYLRFTPNRAIRIGVEDFTKYAFRRWEDFSKRDKYEFLKLWKMIPPEVQDDLRKEHDRTM